MKLDIKPQEKTTISQQDQEIFNSDFMGKLNEDSARGSKSDFNVLGFSNGDLKIGSRDIKDDLDLGLEQFSKFNSESNFIDNGSLSMLYDRVEKDFLEMQYQQQQQAQIQAQLQALKFTQPLNSQELPNSLFTPELDKSRSPEQQMFNFSMPTSLSSISTTGNYQGSEGQLTSPVKISNQPQNISQLPDLQNFDMSDLKDPIKLTELYKSLSAYFGTFIIA